MELNKANMEEESIHSESLLNTRLETKSTKEIFGLLWSEYTRKIKLRHALEKTGTLKFLIISPFLYFLKYVSTYIITNNQEMSFMILDVLTLFRTVCLLANTLPNPTLTSQFQT